MNPTRLPLAKMKTRAIFATVATAVLSLPSVSAQTAIWTAGHGDLGIGYEGGELDPHVHIHTGSVVAGVEITDPEGVEYAPGDAMPYIPLAKGLSRPAGGQWDFFGVAAGQIIWVFPQTQEPTLPFVGLGAEELNPADWSSDFTLTLIGLSGSGVVAGGDFSVYASGAFGSPDVKIQTADGISSADVLTLAAGGHAHYSLAFTQPGLYEATFDIAGLHAVDGAKSATATYTFAVAAIPEPSTCTAIGGAFALGLALWQRRRTRT